MKKRNIIIISLSVISLVFGGLVFLGVSTFPELLEEEKKEIEPSHEDVLFAMPSNNEKQNDEQPVSASIVSSNSPSQFVVSSKSSPHFFTRSSIKEHFTFIHYQEENLSTSVNETTINKEVVTETTSASKTPSTYYKGKSYVSLKRERDTSTLQVKEKVDRSEVIKTRNKNIVNTIVLVVVAIEALAFIILNKKRHSHKSQMPNR